jgi:3-oxo-5-alpha-steroid 4-dehydrogenase 1
MLENLHRNFLNYTGDITYDLVLVGAFLSCGVVIVFSGFMQTPYGRFASDKYGINLGPRLGWFLMELPATISFLFFYLRGENRFEIVPLVFLVMWLIHYGNRGFIFPYLIRTVKGDRSSFAISVVLTGWFVTTAHGYLNATYISSLSTQYTVDWLTDPRFICGLFLYYLGFTLNIHADAIVRNLRTQEELDRGEKVYRIPEGGLFKYVTNPSYFAELLAWAGFAMAAWSWGAMFVFAISMANLVPRAFATQRWYHEKFPDYPKERKVLIPFIL